MTDQPGSTDGPGPDARGSGRPAEATEATAAEPLVSAPRWLEMVALTTALGLSAAGVLGLTLALAGAFTAWATLALAAPVTAVGGWLTWRALPATRASRSTTAAAVVAVALALGFLAFAGARPSQNVMLDRDPGSYTNTARWLARDGSLEVDARGAAFAGVSGLSFTGPAVYDLGTVPLGPGGGPEGVGRLQFQFNHLTSVVLATGYEVGGVRLMFRLPALAVAMGLLIVYAVAVRATRRPWAALLAPGLLAVCAPMLFVARNTYSEPFAMVSLWGAVLALSIFHTTPRRSLAVLGGLLLGTTVSIRIDALLYVALATALAGISVAAISGDRRRQRLRGWLLAAAAAAGPIVVGSVDLYQWTGSYRNDLDDQIELLQRGTLGALVVTVVAAVAWMRLDGARAALLRRRGALAIAAAAAVAGVLMFAWLARPHLQTAHVPDPVASVGRIQQRDGLRLDPSASYAEDSLRWMAWYLGPPALLLAIGGLALVTYRALKDRVDPIVLAILTMALGAGGLYWWAPNITPDQLWATRRFAPAVFPALALMAAIGFTAMATAADRVGRGRASAVGRGLVLSAVVLGVAWPAARSTRPIQKQTVQPGFVAPIEEICAALPDDAAVLMVGRSSAFLLQQTVRSWCGSPTATHVVDVKDLTPAWVTGLASDVQDNGRRLYLVGLDRPAIEALVPDATEPTFVSGYAVSDHNASATLDRAPTGYGGSFTIQLYAIPVVAGPPP